ncbi:MAG: sigma-70 family RNA polymerase sigma factor [Candidatus Tectomicrobia bacterium]|nr:sigma-70 family RNA polymerase sigma factor [Candidatus Tectomicrobia bacterium]
MTTTRRSHQPAHLSHPTGRTRPPQSSRPPREDERHLIRQIANQDHHAFEVLYDLYRPRLMPFLTRYLGSAALCEEVFHEVLLIVWEQAAHFNPTTQVSTWLFGIAHHKALQARASTAKQQSAVTSAPSAWRPEDIPEVRVLQQMQARTVTQALMRLPLEQRTALTLAYYQDYSYPEIAARTGYPVSTVRSQVRQARRRLAAVLTVE